MKGHWVVIGAALAMSPAVSAAEELQFTIGEGRVTLITRGAPLGDVLAEWQRAGRTRFVDARELDEVSVSLHLVDVPEAEALRLLLRPAAGYLAVPRTPRVPGASVYDRVKVLAVRPRSQIPRPAAPTRAARAGPGTTSAPPPPELTEEAQIERLQRLLYPGGRGDEPADAATETRPGRQVPLTTPRPGMIVDAEQPQAAEEPRRRRRGSAREYDPFTAVPMPPPR